MKCLSLSNAGQLRLSLVLCWPFYQGLTPDSEPLERQVSIEYLEALRSDEVRQKDADYWLSTPPGAHSSCVWTVHMFC